MIDIVEIKKLCDNESIRWTNHVLVRLIQRNISTDDIACALRNGEIIEMYPTDYPYPSCLILGATINNKFIHVVCGIGNSELWLITAYHPSSIKWSPDFKLRKEN